MVQKDKLTYLGQRQIINENKKVLPAIDHGGRLDCLYFCSDLGYKCMSWDKILKKKKNSPDWKIDLCIDCSGNSEAIQSAIPLLQYGGTLLIFGVADPTKTIK